MTTSSKVVEMGEGAVLERAESLALLRSVSVGRIVFTEGTLPAVQPVNFLVHDDTVVIRTTAGAKLTSVADGVVGFQADHIDAETSQGWSVTVVGDARVVTDPEELAVLLALPLEAWAPGGRSDFIRIQVENVSVRRLEAADLAPLVPAVRLSRLAG